MATKEQAKKKLKGRWNLYQVAGSKIERKNESCPKCGSGTFMAKHSNRLACGNCKYTVFETQSK